MTKFILSFSIDRLNSRIPGHLLASHWIRIATIVIYFVLQSPPAQVNKVAGYSEVAPIDLPYVVFITKFLCHDWLSARLFVTHSCCALCHIAALINSFPYNVPYNRSYGNCFWLFYLRSNWTSCHTIQRV